MHLVVFGMILAEQRLTHFSNSDVAEGQCAMTHGLVNTLHIGFHVIGDGAVLIHERCCLYALCADVIEAIHERSFCQPQHFIGCERSVSRYL